MEAYEITWLCVCLRACLYLFVIPNNFVACVFVAVEHIYRVVD
jgi:hypothetical protein